MNKILLNGLMIVLATLITGCDPFSSDIISDDTNAPASDLSDTYPYVKDGKYAAVLKKCAIEQDPYQSCTLDTLPLLRQESAHPTKEQIMERVVVSHAWMGERFAQMLDLLDEDIRQLLGGVTAIVIDNDIIPAHYTTLTGAIYLDPRYLWLTPSEAKEITRKEDFRHDFGNALQFIVARRLVKDDQYVYRYYSLDSNQTRTKDDIKYHFARLLYHELAHANDFAPRELTDRLDRKRPIAEVLNDPGIESQYISTRLYQHNPLKSEPLKALGKVLFHGVEATAEQKALLPGEVGAMFAEDGASDMYGYSTQYEDFAMLFEATMMYYHYGIEYDIGFVTQPTKDSNITYRDYVVGWGVRHRIADPLVADRARFVAKNLLPEVTDWDDYFANRIGSSHPLKSEIPWYDSIKLGASDAAKLGSRPSHEERNRNDPFEFGGVME